MMCNLFVEQMVSPISHLAMLAAPAHRELKVTIILIVHVSIQSCETVAIEKFRKNINETFGIVLTRSHFFHSYPGRFVLMYTILS